VDPKILLLDIETAPSVAYVWSLWSEVNSMDFVAEDWYILCWCAKWLGGRTMHRASLPDWHESYKEDPSCDYEVMRDLWSMLNEADVVVAHNATRFDVKKVNTRLLLHGFPPPSPYRVVDTLTIARRHFAFTSNKLNDLGRMLGVGEKKATGGFRLWAGCLSGDPAAWKKMVDYCARDVRLLEKVYLALRPYASGLPNMGVYMDRPVCPRCGSSSIQLRGYTYTAVSKFQRFRCNACGSWSRSRKREAVSDGVLSGA
jgi:hypothetical protein